MKKKTSSPVFDPTPAELLNQLRTLLADAERSLAGGVTEESKRLWSTLQDRFELLRFQVDNALQRGGEKIVVRAKQADETIRTHPYESMAVSLGVGVLIGALLRRD